MKQVRGQALVEFVILFGSTAVVLLQAIALLNAALTQQHDANDQARAELFQLLPSESWQKQPNDYFSAKAGAIVNGSEQVSGLKLPLHDSHSVAVGESELRLARLTESWQIKSPSELASRPARLTLSFHLNRLGIGQAFNLLGYLPLARELRDDSLELGKVDENITPFELRCVDAACR